MPKVYVAGAKVATGGGFMAYHIGRLLYRHFGYEMVNLTVSSLGTTLFKYDVPMKTVNVTQMEAAITEDDLMIVNPSFSHFLFGPRLPGRKIMYIQDYRTFNIMDCHFDLYVSVSQVVRKSIEAVYGIKTSVIPAFIQLKQMPPSLDWYDRTENSSLLYIKNPTPEHKRLTAQIVTAIKKRLPHVPKPEIIEGRGITHNEFLKKLGSVRTFINMSMAEGFGLVPLEAMAMGTMVTGLDGLGGRDYMRSGKNCLVTSVRDLRVLPDIVCEALNDEKFSAECAKRGHATAQSYGHGPFKAAWLNQLSDFLHTKPSNV